MIEIQPGKAESEINVTYEQEGLFDQKDVNKSGRLVPTYNFILQDYDPDFVHISKVENISEGMTSPKLLEKIRGQKRIYHHYIYIDNVIRNLLINNLINEEEKNKLNIHYNFLSKYVHIGMAGIKVWQSVNASDIPPLHRYDEDIFKELIFMYVAKFMYLYIKVFVTHYKDNSNPLEYDNYNRIIEELHSFSKDLWFFDDKPTSFDIEQSDQRKKYLQARNRKVPDNVLYCEDPLRRLYRMKSRNP